MTVSDTATETTLQLYSNPEMIQARALDMLEDQVTGGYPVVDGNNVFTFLLEFSASMTAGIVNETVNAFESLYPARANKMSDLYKHMSDFDYVGLFSSPSNTEIYLYLKKKFIVDNAVEVPDTNYSKITIPQYSTFTIGTYTFGIHYPIDIKVNIARYADGSGNDGEINYQDSTITCYFDNTNPNPLYTLITNVLESNTYTQDNEEITCIKIPVFQFSVNEVITDAVASTGFAIKIPYTDRFYAIRVFNYKLTEIVNEETGSITGYTKSWDEITQTFHDLVYDVNYPTAKITVNKDSSFVTVNIPQIYFTKDLIGSKIRCLVYTTKGALDIDISSYDDSQFGASFLVNDEVVGDEYSSMLKRISYIYVRPTTTKINNGSNGLTFSEMRDRVVHNSSYTTMITTNDITNYFSDQGFTISKYIDNVTNRIFLAKKEITDADGVTIDAGCLNTEFNKNTLTLSLDSTGKYIYKNHSTFKYISAESFMILPTTIYKYDPNEDKAIPLTDNEVNTIDYMETDNKINLLNDNYYTCCPYHLKVSCTNDIPTTTYYNLYEPSVTGITFEFQNTEVNSSMMIYSTYITHLNNGTGGYEFDVTVYMSADLAKITQNETNFKVVLLTYNSSGSLVYQEGTYSGISSSSMPVFKFNIATSYKINDSSYIDTTSFKSYDSKASIDCNIPLQGYYQLRFYVLSTIDNENVTSSDAAANAIDPILGDSYTRITTQSFTITLGSIVDMLFSKVAMSVTEQNYKKYPTTEYSTYNTDVYDRYESGEVTDPKLVGTYKYPLEILHEIGEIIEVGDTSTGTEVITPISCVESITGSTMYLSKPYTATSSTSNKYYTTITHTEESDPSIIVLDLMELCNFYITTTDPELKIKTVSTVTELYIKGSTCGAFHDGEMFVYVETPNTDDCECNPFNYTDREIQNEIGAIYRKNAKYTTTASTYTAAISVYSHKEYGSYKAGKFTEESVTALYEEIDEKEKTETEIITDWGITSDILDYYKNIRLPWIKWFAVRQLSDVTEYLENRIISITDPDADDSSKTKNYDVTTIRTIQDELDLKKVVVFKTIDEYTKSEKINNTYYYITNSQRFFKHIDDSTSDMFLTKGSDKRECIAKVLSWNTYSGFGYEARIGSNIYLVPLSYTGTGLTCDYKKCSWSDVDNWPWEVEYDWIDESSVTCSSLKMAYNTKSSAQYKHLVGDVWLEDDTAQASVMDENGNLLNNVTDTSVTRLLTYTVSMLHIDYKLIFSDETAHKNYMTSIISKLKSIFTSIENGKEGLLEDTSLYFCPIKTIGYGKFKGIDGTEDEVKTLDITMKFRLHVTSAIGNSSTNKTLITNTILNIIDKHIATGTISQTKIATDVKEALGDSVLYIDTLGINGDFELQTLIDTDDDCNPHLRQLLVLNKENNTVYVNRGLELLWSIVS